MVAILSGRCSIPRTFLHPGANGGIWANRSRIIGKAIFLEALSVYPEGGRGERRRKEIFMRLALSVARR